MLYEEFSMFFFLLLCIDIHIIVIIIIVVVANRNFYFLFFLRWMIDWWHGWKDGYIWDKWKWTTKVEYVKWIITINLRNGQMVFIFFLPRPFEGLNFFLLSLSLFFYNYLSSLYRTATTTTTSTIIIIIINSNIIVIHYYLVSVNDNNRSVNNFYMYVCVSDCQYLLHY